MHDAPVVDALRVSLRAMAQRTWPLATEDSGLLRLYLCAAVNDLKNQGMTADHVVGAIRQLSADAGMPPAGAPIFEQMLEWCIEGYFD